MKRQDILSIGLKLLGVYVLIQAVQSLQYFFAWLAQAIAFPGDPATIVGSVLATVVPFVLLAGGAFFLMRRSDLIATRMLRDGPEASAGEGHVSASEIQAIAFAVLGLAIIALAIPKICPVAVSLYYMSRTDVGLSRTSVVKQLWGSVLSLVVQAAIGAVLFLRAQGVVNMWRKLQLGRYEERSQGGATDG